MVYSTISYIQLGLLETTPKHIINLWIMKYNGMHILRDRVMETEPLPLPGFEMKKPSILTGTLSQPSSNPNPAKEYVPSG